jgi:hypothetical protein
MTTRCVGLRSLLRSYGHAVEVYDGAEALLATMRAINTSASSPTCRCRA